MPMRSCDIIVIGGGHNGLVAAAYLARAGFSVTLLEADRTVGGAARTVTLRSGLRIPGCAHILGQLNSEIVDDLSLESHGLDYAMTDMESVALDQGGRHLVLKGASGELLGEGVPESERSAWARMRGQLARFARALTPTLHEMPPHLTSQTIRETTSLARVGWRLRKLGTDDMREFLRIALMNVADYLDDELRDDRLKGLIAFDAVLGTHLGPRSPTSMLPLLYRWTGDVLGQQGALAQPRGGMGAVSEAIAAVAEGAGTSIVLGAEVERILVAGDRIAGVRLATGDELRADCVLSAINPRTTLLGLLGTEYLDTGLVRRLLNMRMHGNVAKLHLALEGVPEFTGLERLHLDGRLVIAPGVDALERAFNPAKYGEFSAHPTMEITIPSIADPTLATAGRHVLSANVQYAPFALRQGWDRGRAAFAEATLAQLDRYAPGIREQITDMELLSPADIERIYRIPGGHWHHGELACDQFFTLRPVPGVARYTAPVPGLYLCGAGTHPGGGVSGASGRNAAMRIIEGERRA